MLGPIAAICLEGHDQPDDEQKTFQDYEKSTAGVRRAPLVEARSEHPEEAKQQGEPTRQCYEDGPVTGPVVVRADDRESAYEHQRPGKVDDRWDLGVVEVRLHERELGNEHRHERRADEAGDSLRLLQVASELSGSLTNRA